MLNKKYFLILLLLIISICALSTASASDNATDSIAIDNSKDIVAIDESNINDLEKNSDKSDNQEILANSQEDSKIFKDESQETLSYYMWSPDADDYNVKFIYGTYNHVGSYKDKDIRYNLIPYDTGNIYYYKYDFVLEGSVVTQFLRKQNVL